ncbi:amyloid-beta precursor protein-like [Haemaphysalis longicornis]
MAAKHYFLALVLFLIALHDSMSVRPGRGNNIGNRPSQGSCKGLPDSGPCKAFMISWYYSGTFDLCFPFVFGGCKGNRNNYPSCFLCMKKCSKSPAKAYRYCGCLKPYVKDGANPRAE